jgi:hypothetical protein
MSWCVAVSSISGMLPQIIHNIAAPSFPFHEEGANGGNSTGPRTPEGHQRSTRARWKHGSYSAEAECEFRRLQAQYRVFTAVQQAGHTASFAGMRLLLKRERTELRNVRRRLGRQ